VHDDAALRYLIDVAGIDTIMLGTDYPFPLGEQEPGKGIASLGLDASDEARLYHGTALEWLGLPKQRFVPTPDRTS
jgi:aminocarboxymuconate-semialdehyde decarboxylase